MIVFVLHKSFISNCYLVSFFIIYMLSFFTYLQLLVSLWQEAFGFLLHSCLDVFSTSTASSTTFFKRPLYCTGAMDANLDDESFSFPYDHEELFTALGKKDVTENDCGDSISRKFLSTLWHSIPLALLLLPFSSTTTNENCELLENYCQIFLFSIFFKSSFDCKFSKLFRLGRAPAAVSLRQHRLRRALALADEDNKNSNNFSLSSNRNARQRWRWALHQIRNLEDPWRCFHIEELPAERAVRHRYSALKKSWVQDEVRVKIENLSFNHGAMRECFRL